MGKSILEEPIVNPASHNTIDIGNSSSKINQAAAAVVRPRPPSIKLIKSGDQSSINHQGSLAVGNSQTSRRRSSSFPTASTADEEEFAISKATPTTVTDECARRNCNINRGQHFHFPQVKTVSACKPATAAEALDGGGDLADDGVTSRSGAYNDCSARTIKTSDGSYNNNSARASRTWDGCSSSNSNRKRDRRGSLSNNILAGGNGGNSSDDSYCNGGAAVDRSGAAAATEPSSLAAPEAALLPPLSPEEAGWRKTLVLDLDETLVHSSFKEIREYDFSIRVEMAAGQELQQQQPAAAATQPRMHTVYVRKRPGVDELLEAAAGELQYEVVVFTAGLKAYADAVLDVVDSRRRVAHRLYRDSCRQHAGGLVKDLSLLGRDLRRVLILDNNPHCYLLHPRNALPISSFFDNPHDRELLDLIPLLAALSHLDNVVDALAALGLA